MSAEVGNIAGNTYDKYASTNPIEQRMMKGFFNALESMVADLDPQLVVEVGAGEGRITHHLAALLPRATVVGLDLPDDGLAESWGDATSPLFFGDVTRLPMSDASVDLVVGLEVLEHVPSPERALAEIHRVASDTVLLSVPREPIWRIGNIARARYLRDLGNTPGHVNHWSTRSFLKFVETRFDVVESASPIPWTMVRARPRPTK